MPIVMACMSMSKQKVGALIVIERNLPLNDIIRSGELIDANINQRLIENIFFKNSPLHDGAMIISKKRIKAAGCILPVSHSMDIPKELGLRHRAAKDGTTISYGELARRIHNPKAVRAVASANATNPISIFVPCHRVIGSNHKLTGYGGGLDAKKGLLGLECSNTEGIELW